MYVFNHCPCCSDYCGVINTNWLGHFTRQSDCLFLLTAVAISQTFPQVQSKVCLLNICNLSLYHKLLPQYIFLPSSVSCHTMPSRLTLVPGSQGPKHSGSVDRATSDVLTATERVRTISCSQGEAMSLFPIEAWRWSGGGAGVETGDSIWRKTARERQKQGR